MAKNNDISNEADIGDKSVDDSALGFGEGDAAAPGLLDELKPVEDTSVKKDEEPTPGAQDKGSSSEELAPKTTDEPGELPETPHTPAEEEPTQSETPNAEPAVDVKQEAAAPAPAPAAEEPASDEPAAFGELHGEVNELTDVLDHDMLEEMKKAGDALTPAVSKLHGIETELHKLGDEAKARFTFAKAKMVEAMGALERLFTRGN